MDSVHKTRHRNQRYETTETIRKPGQRRNDLDQRRGLPPSQEPRSDQNSGDAKTSQNAVWHHCNGQTTKRAAPPRTRPTTPQTETKHERQWNWHAKQANTKEAKWGRTRRRTKPEEGQTHRNCKSDPLSWQRKTSKEKNISQRHPTANKSGRRDNQPHRIWHKIHSNQIRSGKTFTHLDEEAPSDGQTRPTGQKKPNRKTWQGRSYRASHHQAQARLYRTQRGIRHRSPKQENSQTHQRGEQEDHQRPPHRNSHKKHVGLATGTSRLGTRQKCSPEQIAREKRRI